MVWVTPTPAPSHSSDQATSQGTLMVGTLFSQDLPETSSVYYDVGQTSIGLSNQHPPPVLETLTSSCLMNLFCRLVPAYRALESFL